MKLRFWEAASLLTFLGLPIHPSFAGPEYTMVELGLPPGFVSSRATGINNGGQVVGWAATKDDICHAILWDNGRALDLGTMGGSDSLSAGISDSGEVVGAVIRDGTRRVFLWRRGQALDLGMVDEVPTRLGAGNFNPGLGISRRGKVIGCVMNKDGEEMCFLYETNRMTYVGGPRGGITGFGQALNDQGQIAGQCSIDRQRSHAVLWRNGETVILGGAGGSWAGATAINERGTVVGWAFVTGSTQQTAHAFLWEGGHIRDLGTLGGNTSRARGINDTNQVVGYTSTATGEYAAFLWEKGAMLDLNHRVTRTPGWRLTCGDAINDRGQIAALANHKGNRRACLLSISAPGFERPPAEVAKTVATVSNTPPVPMSGLNLTDFGVSPSGGFRLEFTGAAAGNYVLEASTNLVTWTPLGQPEGSEGRWQITDTNAAHLSLRFYRIVLKP